MIEQEEIKIPIKKGTKTLAILKLLTAFINYPTDKELELIATLIDNKLYVLSKDNRVKLRMAINMDKYTFNTYIKRLKDKGVFIKNKEGVLTINSYLIVLTSNNSITIKFDESAG